MRSWLCVQGVPTAAASVLVSLMRDTRMTRCWEGSRARLVRTVESSFPRQLFTHVPGKTCTQRGIDLEVRQSWKEPRRCSQPEA